MGKLIVVVGGQYGSEAKGRAVQALTEREEPWRKGVAVMRVGGPNAGHCVYDDKGRLLKLRQVPAGAVVPNVRLLIGPGSEVNPYLLKAEVGELDSKSLAVSERLSVDHRATLLTDDHIVAEGADGMNERLGSTQSGVGAARAARIQRTAELYGGHEHTDQVALNILDWGGTVIVEGVQGFGLGQHAGDYPYCTSINARAIDMLSLAGISPWDDVVTEFEVWVVFRTRPIRVAGNSGPLHGETTWEQIGQEPEITTVTKRVRRVGSWDPALAYRAVMSNGGSGKVKVWLSMVDYEDETLEGREGVIHPGDNRIIDMWAMRLKESTGVYPSAYGTGPATNLWAYHDEWDHEVNIEPRKPARSEPRG
jgi:adenylosuccinate synthase